MKVSISAGRAKGKIVAPPSKSMSHRLLICSGLCKGTSIIHGIAPSEDIKATLDCLKAIGAKYTWSGETVTINGIDPVTMTSEAYLYCRESGSTLRFFIPICLLNNKNVILKGSKSLFSRPLTVYENICTEQNMLYSQDEDSLMLKGKLKCGEYKIPGNISSQFVSGLLFALPNLDSDSILNIIPPIESCSYINLTIQALKEFGVNVEWKDERTIYIKGGQKFVPKEVTVEGDYSNSAFFETLNVIGGDVEISGLNAESLQGDKEYFRYFEMLKRGTPTIHIANCPDLGPILFAVAAAKNGGVFTGTRRLRIKESDRGTAMAQELEKFGTAVKVYDDTIVVYPKEFHQPSSTLYGHNDHRIVMALSVLLSITGGEIDGAEAVKKSMPDFFEKLHEIGIEVKKYEI